MATEANQYRDPDGYPRTTRRFSSGRTVFERSNVPCMNHPRQESRCIELYCLQCNVGLCWKCKNTQHNEHSTEELTATAERVQEQLTEYQRHIKLVQDELLNLWTKLRNDDDAVKRKKEAIRAEIEERRKAIIDLANRLADEAIKSLDTQIAIIRQPMVNLLTTQGAINSLYTRVATCTGSKDAAQLVTDAGKLYSDLTQQNAQVEKVRKDCESSSRLVSRPTLQYSVSSDLFADVCRNFIGTAVRQDMSLMQPLAKVREQFRCPKGKVRDIFSLLATQQELYVSYDVNPADGLELTPEKLNHNGQTLMWRTSPTSKGKCSFTVTDNGSCGVLKHNGGDVIQSYAKSRKGVMLLNDMNGTAALVFKTLKDPSSSDLEAVQAAVEGMSVGCGFVASREQVIPCGPHRSFDLHPTSPLLVVVQEPCPLSACYRSVFMFSNGQKGVYGSPITPYQPSDVCFHKLSGRDVLLVADELNDAIHVVDVQTGTFQRYLSPGDPHVVKPTALSVDSNGKVWIACRGGTVLVCEALSG